MEVLTQTSGLQLTNAADIMAFSNTLKKFISDNKLSCTIQGKEYAFVDGWKFAGLNFGLTAIPEEPVELSNKELIKIFFKETPSKYDRNKMVLTPYLATDVVEQIEEEMKKKQQKVLTTRLYKYKCVCNIINISTGAIVGKGSAICTNLELKKSDFDEYAISSMAQTRAIAKGYRNLLGFIMNAAGFEPTPAEEMEEDKYHEKDGRVDDDISEPIINAIEQCDTVKKLGDLYERLTPSERKNKKISGALQSQKLKLSKHGKR